MFSISRHACFSSLTIHDLSLWSDEKSLLWTKRKIQKDLNLKYTNSASNKDSETLCYKDQHKKQKDRWDDVGPISQICATVTSAAMKVRGLLVLISYQIVIKVGRYRAASYSLTSPLASVSPIVALTSSQPFTRGGPERAEEGTGTTAFVFGFNPLDSASVKSPNPSVVFAAFNAEVGARSRMFPWSCYYLSHSSSGFLGATNWLWTCRSVGTLAPLFFKDRSASLSQPLVRVFGGSSIWNGLVLHAYIRLVAIFIITTGCGCVIWNILLTCDDEWRMVILKVFPLHLVTLDLMTASLGAILPDLYLPESPEAVVLSLITSFIIPILGKFVQACDRGSLPALVNLNQPFTRWKFSSKAWNDNEKRVQSK